MSTGLENRVSWVRIPPEQLIFLRKERVVSGVVVLRCLIVYYYARQEKAKAEAVNAESRRKLEDYKVPDVCPLPSLSPVVSL